MGNLRASLGYSEVIVLSLYRPPVATGLTHQVDAAILGVALRIGLGVAVLEQHPRRFPLGLVRTIAKIHPTNGSEVVLVVLSISDREIS